MNLATAFASNAGRVPAKTALFWGEREFSYAELSEQSERVAGALRDQHGVQPGDRVALWLKNCPEFIPAVFGILQTGAVIVPINNFYKPAEVRYIVEDCGAKVLISDDSMAAGLAEMEAGLPGLHCLRIEQLLKKEAFQASSANLGCQRRETDLAVLIYTSGTTGRPKGAMLSHGNILHNVESCRLLLKYVENDRIVVLLPMFHSYMLTVGIFLPMIMGSTIILIRSVHPPRNVIQEILVRGATILPGIPQFFRSLVQSQMEVKLPLRMAICGAAPLPVQVLKEFEQRFGFPLLEGYGLSEASPVVAKNPFDGVRKAGSIGPAIPNVEISIQDDEGGMLGTGEIGELCVRGGNVMMGYWNQAAETAKALRNGWLLTGDVGYRDEDGYYFITDRKKDMLLVNGINVYPREVEEILYQYPGVKEAAVIGVPDNRKGEQPLAFIAVNDGVMVEERQVIQFARERLADYKVPKRIVTLSALPRNATGKILKTALRELASNGQTEESESAA